jgi:WD40 repeat protein
VPIPASTWNEEGTLFDVRFSPDGKVVRNTLCGGAELLYDAKSRLLGPPLPPGAAGHRVVFSPAGKRFCVLGMRGAVVWDVQSNDQVGPTLRHRGGATAAAFRPDGKAILTAGADGTTCVWEVRTGRRLGPPLRHAPAVTAVAFAPDGQTYLTADRANTLRRWQAQTGRQVGEALRGPAQEYAPGAVSFTADGKDILCQTGWILYVWEVASGRRIAALHNHGWVRGSGGRTLALVTGELLAQGGGVRLFDVERRQHRGVAATANPANIDFSGDGRILATGNEEAAELWDVVTGKPIGPPLYHPEALLTVTFDPKGGRLLTCCGDDMARFWEVPRPVAGTARRIGLWVEVLTHKALDEAGTVRPLSQAEWEQRRGRLAALGGPPAP